MPNKNKKRVPCKYPMNLFFNYEDEVPSKTRVSTPEDCEICKVEDCEEKYCLITERKEKK